MKETNDQRLLLAIVLCVAVYYAWSAYFLPPPSTVATEEPPTDPTAAAEAGAAEATAATAATPVAPTEGPCEPRLIELKTDDIQAGVSTCGGALSNVILPDYQSSVLVVPVWTWVKETVLGDGGEWNPYVPATGVEALVGPEGQFGLVGQGAPTAALVSGLSDDAWQPVNETPLLLQRSTADGLTITKTIKLTDQPDLFELTVRWESTTPVSGPFWFGFADQYQALTSATDNHVQPVAVVDGDLEALADPAKLAAEPTVYTEPVQWFGASSRYFLLAALPERSDWGTLQWISLGENRVGNFLIASQDTVAPGQPLELKLRVFAGVKNVERMSAIDASLEESAKLGFFGFFAKVLLFFLHIFQSGLQNWGLSIIALTFLVRATFYPLSAKAYRNAKAMQVVQPLLKEIQEKYAEDREAISRETMKLFQEHKVNPFGGCLPLLVQMPVFFALLSALQSTPDLYQQSFLYIQDLSSPDPFGVFPTFMAVGMYVQQSMTPMTGVDPQQQRIMKLMPLMFAVFMYTVPAGLAVYYAVNTVLSILQQWYNTRMYATPAPEAARG